MTRGSDYLAAADDALRETYEPPMGLAEYLDYVVEHPTTAAHASKYLLDAIEAPGTRTVVEEGEERERYRFFDDPYNDGEHAVLGNTATLNDFVADLRAIAAGRGKEEKIVWLDGPTATGKSELKRCLVNGLRAYSKTEAGRRYTLTWNVRGEASSPGMTYGDAAEPAEDDWYRSPVQAHPLAVLPDAVRDEVLADVNAELDDHIPVRVPARLDPFSREAYDHLAEQYRRQGREDLFSAVADPQHLRVENYVADLGQGIGVLHAEDDGTPKERLVGSWMPGMVQALDSRGRKNPQAFSYDGVLSQGNGLLTVVEDAAQHADLLSKLLNVPDEGSVKLDKGIGMEVDTQMLVISNPDLGARLNEHAAAGESDPLKALKRRLERHEFGYLTNRSLEAELVRRELTDETAVWTAEEGLDPDDRAREPLRVRVRVGTGTEVRDREFAPHAIEAAALYAVVTRLDADDLPGDLDLVEKALLFDRGYLQDGDERLTTDDFAFADDATDGERGIPVTFTRDVLAELLAEPSDRSHATLPVEDVITPGDAVSAMADRLADAPVFSTGERRDYGERATLVHRYVREREEADVLDALLRDDRPDPGTVAEYVEGVHAWAEGEQVVNARGERVDPDPLALKVFETESLGRFGEEDYAGTAPSTAVERFRREQVVTAMNRHAWRNRDERYRAAELAFEEIPALRAVLERNDWDDVARLYDEFEPAQWPDPPEGTVTARLKRETIANMVELFDYSEASAELASRRVLAEVRDRWD
ncbi:PrkA family serine protein kinase [Halosegnis marinus]|uniref:PrkA family serine protein kinase n=1 Tax=Halosegnis marinus TaxID=3034023 RepID=A0ABD5ZT19_9EURY|nr:kinase anchor protein [Halosegnis sp. DT85]